MTTDAWERNYANSISPDGLVDLHTYEYRWKEASSRFGVRTQRRRPPFSFFPGYRNGLNNTLQIRWEPYGASGDVTSGICYTRLQSAPTFSGGAWVGGMRETVQVIVNAASGYGPGVGFCGDEDFRAQAWEVGASDFSTPLPSWPWERMPTHFTLPNRNAVAIMCAPGDLSGLHARSEEIPWCAAGMTSDAQHATTVSATATPALNAGPLGNRMAAWLRASPGAFGLGNGAIMYRRPSDGGLLASLFYEQENPLAPNLAGGSFGYAGGYEFGGGENVRLVDLHFGTLPTYRARVWGYAPDSTPFDGGWGVLSLGRYGAAASWQYVAAPYTVAGGPPYEATCDSTLDLNSLTYPAGTSHLYVGFDPVLAFSSIHLSCIEGPDNLSFPAAGTRSDLGGSVYIPGRMIRVGTVADDGTAT